MPAVLVNQPVEAPKAPVPVPSLTLEATKPSDPLPSYLNEESRATIREPFNALTHLNYKPPNGVLTMKEIGLEGRGISPIAASEPFPLFSQEAIQQMRAEIFSDECLEECQFTSTFSKFMVRGMGPARAPFTYAAWNSPELISRISEVAGIDLIPSIDYEIANINISFSGGSAAQPQPQSDAVKAPEDPLAPDSATAFAWHYDSFPFVCVVMLSDCTDMVGGETALRMPSGEVMKVRGPTMGTAVVMQGRYIEHQALKAIGGRERISMVTCFRPKSLAVRDETVLTGVRGISYRSDLYTQYTEYRLEVLEERIREKQKLERRRIQANKSFDVPEMRKWLEDQKGFIDALLAEIY